MDPYIGKMLDNRYEILELIGRGGMANVYKAKCHRLDRLVAVKILHSDLAQNADFRRRFMDESRAVVDVDPHGDVRNFRRVVPAFGPMWASACGNLACRPEKDSKTLVLARFW